MTHIHTRAERHQKRGSNDFSDQSSPCRLACRRTSNNKYVIIGLPNDVPVFGFNSTDRVCLGAKIFVSSDFLLRTSFRSFRPIPKEIQTTTISVHRHIHMHSVNNTARITQNEKLVKGLIQTRFRELNVCREQDFRINSTNRIRKRIIK